MRNWKTLLGLGVVLALLLTLIGFFGAGSATASSYKTPLIGANTVAKQLKCRPKTVVKTTNVFEGRVTGKTVTCLNKNGAKRVGVTYMTPKDQAEDLFRREQADDGTWIAHCWGYIAQAGNGHNWSFAEKYRSQTDCVPMKLDGAIAYIR